MCGYRRWRARMIASQLDINKKSVWKIRVLTCLKSNGAEYTELLTVPGREKHQRTGITLTSCNIFLSSSWRGSRKENVLKMWRPQEGYNNRFERLCQQEWWYTDLTLYGLVWVLVFMCVGLCVGQFTNLYTGTLTKPDQLESHSGWPKDCEKRMESPTQEDRPRGASQSVRREPSQRKISNRNGTRKINRLRDRDREVIKKNDGKYGGVRNQRIK